MRLELTSYRVLQADEVIESPLQHLFRRPPATAPPSPSASSSIRALFEEPEPTDSDDLEGVAELTRKRRSESSPGGSYHRRKSPRSTSTRSSTDDEATSNPASPLTPVPAMDPPSPEPIARQQPHWVTQLPPHRRNELQRMSLQSLRDLLAPVVPYDSHAATRQRLRNDVASLFTAQRIRDEAGASSAPASAAPGPGRAPSYANTGDTMRSGTRQNANSETTQGRPAHPYESPIDSAVAMISSHITTIVTTALQIAVENATSNIVDALQAGIAGQRERTASPTRHTPPGTQPAEASNGEHVEDSPGIACEYGDPPPDATCLCTALSSPRARPAHYPIRPHSIPSDSFGPPTLPRSSRAGSCLGSLPFARPGAPLPSVRAGQLPGRSRRATQLARALLSGARSVWPGLCGRCPSSVQVTM